MGDDFLQEFSLAMRSKGPSCQLEQLLLQGMQFGIGGAAAIGTFLTTNALLQVSSAFLSTLCACEPDTDCRSSTSKIADCWIPRVGALSVASSDTKKSDP